MVPILYGVKYSSPVTSILFIAEEIGIGIDYREISLLKKDHHKPAFLKMNPQHTVPTLDDNGKILWDSHAIATYLVDKYAFKSDDLYPKDIYVRGRINQRLHYDSGIISIVHQNCLRALVYHGALDITEKDRIDIKNIYTMMESLFASTSELYLVGNNLTVADAVCGFSIGPLNIFEPISGNWPKLNGWWLRLEGHTLFKKLNFECLTELRKHLPEKYRII